MRQCFAELDEDGGGAIGIEELEGPLIAMGLVDTTQQINKLIDLVDDDNSSEVEFEEFLNIIKLGGLEVKENPEEEKGDTEIKQEEANKRIFGFF